MENNEIISSIIPNEILAMFDEILQNQFYQRLAKDSPYFYSKFFKNHHETNFNNFPLPMLSLQIFTAEIYDVMTMTHTDTLRLALLPPMSFVNTSNENIVRRLKFELQKMQNIHLNKAFSRFYFHSKYLFLSLMKISNSNSVPLQSKNMAFRCLELLNKTIEATIYPTTISTPLNDSTKSHNESSVTLQNLDLETTPKKSDNLQLKKLKALLMAAKKHNDSLNAQIESSKALKTENESLRARVNENVHLKTELDVLKRNNDNLRLELEDLTTKFEVKQASLVRKIQASESELKLETQKYEYLQNEIQQYKVKTSIKPKSDSLPTIESLIEKHRYDLMLNDITTKYQSSVQELEDLKSQVYDLTNKNSELNLLLNDIKTSFNEEKRQLELANNLKLIDYENAIESLQNEIQTLTLKLESRSAETPDFSENITSITEVHDKSPENVHQSTLITADVVPETKQHERILHKILFDNDSSKSVIESKGVNEDFMSDLIDTESENNLLKEQIAVLKQELRRIERILRGKDNTNFEPLRTLVIQFITGDSSTRSHILPYLVETLQLTQEELEELKQKSTEHEEVHADSIFSRIFEYMAKWT